MIKRWCAYNYLWVMRLLATSMLLLIPIFRYFDPPMLVVFLIILLAVYFIISFPRTLPRRLIQQDLKTLDNDCDPYPLLEDTKLLLHSKHNPYLATNKTQSEAGYVGSPHHFYQSLTIDLCLALYYLGQVEEAIEKLLALGVERSPYCSLATKASYFQLLSVCYLNTGNIETSQAMHDQFLSVFHRLSPKEQDFYHYALQTHEIFSFIQVHEHEKANALLQTLCQRPLSMRTQIELALSQATVYICQKQPQAAKEQLDFILRHGNKLQLLINRAKQLLAKCEE